MLGVENHEQELPAASDPAENWVTRHGLGALGYKKLKLILFSVLVLPSLNFPHKCTQTCPNFGATHTVTAAALQPQTAAVISMVSFLIKTELLTIFSRLWIINRAFFIILTKCDSWVISIFLPQIAPVLAWLRVPFYFCHEAWGLFFMGWYVG